MLLEILGLIGFTLFGALIRVAVWIASEIGDDPRPPPIFIQPFIDRQDRRNRP